MFAAVTGSSDTRLYNWQAKYGGIEASDAKNLLTPLLRIIINSKVEIANNSQLLLWDTSKGFEMLKYTVFAAFLAVLLSSSAYADDYVLTLKDHQFTPASLQIPADQKVKIIVKNASLEPAEFESSDFNREKIVSPGSEIIVFIGPLSAGSYGYFDDFHRETTGTIVVK